MGRSLIELLKKDPWGVLKRGLYKVTLGPWKYSRGKDYDAARYWQERFQKYGTSIKGAADEGLSEEENQRRYQGAADVFIQLCQREQVDFTRSRVLEIGCGTGFYTRLLYQLGAKDYTGVDITDQLFGHLQKEFPEYKFLRRDATQDKIEGKFDLVVSIDVIEHIVTPEKFSAFMTNVKFVMAPVGVFIVASLGEENKKRLFYLRDWSPDDLTENFEGYAVGKPVPFRDGSIVAVRKKV